MIDTKALRSRVLDLAIRGKLTEQLPSDGTAEELYQQIQAEKQKLIKEGKIKKEKLLPPVSPEEVTFEIPENWMWVRIGQVINEVIVPQRDKPSFSGDIPWCRIEDKDGIFLNGTKSGQYVSKETVKEMNLRIFPIGTVLSACSGASIGTILITTVECCTNQTFNGLVCSTGLYNWFLFWYLKSAITKLKSMGTGSAMAYISQKRIRNMLLTLPPLAEQKRIVERVEEIFRLLDAIDEAQEKYAEDAQILKAKLITTGIQGKLTEQLPSDGTAEELYQQIQAEKQKLIKEGKLKKEKPLPEIKPEELPFEIPRNWKWVRLGEISNAVTGRLDANQQVPDGQYPFFTCGQEVYKIDEYAFDCDAILLGGNNASGDYKMHRYNGKFNAYQRVYVITLPPHDTLDYLFYVIGYWLPLLKFNSQGAMTRFIRIGQVHNMLVPLPPLAEQKRIVEVLERVVGEMG